MNGASMVVLAVILGLAGWAVWHNLRRKGGCGCGCPGCRKTACTAAAK